MGGAYPGVGPGGNYNGPAMGRGGGGGGGWGDGGYRGRGGGGPRGGFQGGHHGGPRPGGPPHHHGGFDDSQVVMIYGVDQDRINADRLFNLLCLYGNCEKAKLALLLTFICSSSVAVIVDQVHEEQAGHVHGADERRRAGADGD